MNGDGCIVGGKAVLKIKKYNYLTKEVNMAEKKESGFKNFRTFVVGFFLLVLGITLILSYWSQVVIFFKGIIGFILAMAGLLVLYTLNKK